MACPEEYRRIAESYFPDSAYDRERRVRVYADWLWEGAIRSARAQVATMSGIPLRHVSYEMGEVKALQLLIRRKIKEAAHL